MRSFMYADDYGSAHHVIQSRWKSNNSSECIWDAFLTICCVADIAAGRYNRRVSRNDREKSDADSLWRRRAPVGRNKIVCDVTVIRTQPLTHIYASKIYLSFHTSLICIVLLLLFFSYVRITIFVSICVIGVHRLPFVLGRARAHMSHFSALSTPLCSLL